MSFFDVLGSIFEKWPMTDLTNVIVSMCLVSYNFCMIPHVLTVTFGLNLSGAWGVLIPTSTLSPYYQCLQMQPPARQWYLAAMYKPCRGNNLTPAPSRCKEVQKIRQLIWRLPNFYQRQISFITRLHPGPGQPGTSTGNTQNARILQQEMYYLPAQNKHATAET